MILENDWYKNSTKFTFWLIASTQALVVHAKITRRTIGAKGAWSEPGVWCKLLKYSSGIVDHPKMLTTQKIDHQKILTPKTWTAETLAVHCPYHACMQTKYMAISHLSIFGSIHPGVDEILYFQKKFILFSNPAKKVWYSINLTH